MYRFLATDEDSDGKYALWEAIVPPGGGPPPHVHSREEEDFYILEGEITFQIGEERVVATAGMFANMPVGTPHTFKNESSQPAKMLITVAPDGLEQMFFECGVPVAQGATTAPPPSKAEIEMLLEIAPRYGIEIRLMKTDYRLLSSDYDPAALMRTHLSVLPGCDFFGTYAGQGILGGARTGGWILQNVGIRISRRSRLG